MDAYLDYLPFEAHIEIARYLSLKDALAYAGVCTQAHDAVYYVFSHRKELNFTSILLDDSGCIALPDAMILSILHAHVRAETIVSFALPSTFSMFAELESYFSMYWRVLINHQDIQVGHSSGHLQYVHYRHYYGLPYCAPHANRNRMSNLCNSLEPYDEYLSRFNRSFARENGEFQYSEPYANWCNTDLDTRYHICSCCQGFFPSDDLSSDGLCPHCQVDDHICS